MANIPSLRDLEDYEEKISDAEDEISEAKGRISVNKKRLKDEYGLESDDDVGEYLFKASEEIKSMESELGEKYKDLEDSMKNVKV